MAGRIAVVLVATLVLAWLAVMERDERLHKDAVSAAGRLDVPGNFARADDGFRRARLLSPDTTPDIGRAVLYEGAGRLQAAAAVLEDIVRREPENRTAWGLLFLLTRDRDPAAAARARAAVRRLDPFGTRSR